MAARDQPCAGSRSPFSASPSRVPGGHFQREAGENQCKNPSRLAGRGFPPAFHLCSSRAMQEVQNQDRAVRADSS